jgi:pimeloyl-ACP methyl ester carboxylesterase
VVYDRRGRGASGDTQPWAIDREVEDIAALVAIAGGSAVLFASSSGAAIALAAVAADIGVTGLILYEPPFFAGAGKADQIATVRDLVGRGRNADAMRYNLAEVVGMPVQVVDGIERSPAWPAMCAVAPTLVYDLSAVDAVNTDPDWPARWSRIGVPVDVYSGANSFPALAGAADAVAAAIPGARRRTLAGESHNPSAEAIVEVVRTVSVG